MHYLNSHSLALKPHPFISKQSFKSCVRDFAHICSGLNTDPQYIAKLIREISKSFYLREIRAPRCNLRHNLADAFYLAKVLCMLQHKLINNKLYQQVDMLFNLSVNFFCDIVFFTDTVDQSRYKYMIKHKKVYRHCILLETCFKIRPRKVTGCITCFPFFARLHTLGTHRIYTSGKFPMFRAPDNASLHHTYIFI